MKAIYTATIAIVFAIVLLTSQQLFAQSGTMVVYANGPTLDQIIGADTTSTGAQKHSVYQLVSLDTTYIFDATITFKSAVSIVGVPDPSTGKLPTIQPDVLSDNSIPSTFFAFNGKGTRNVVKNIYFEGLAINNTFGYGVALSVLADSITITADNLVFDEMSGDAFSYQSSWDNLYITNCKMRNSINSVPDYYEGEFIRNQNGDGAFKTDSIVIKYCTLNCMAAYVCAATGGIVNYFECSHCDIINTCKNPFFLDRAVNAKFDNNLFFNAYSVGTNYTEFSGGWDSFTAGTLPSIITLGPLDSTTAATLLGHASIGAADPAAEKLRKIEVMNNDYFWSSDLTSFYTSWNDTAHTDSIYTPVWENSQTINMFTDKTTWPGLNQSGNTNVDPGFGASVDNSVKGGTGYADGLLAYVAAVRSGGTGVTYGNQITVVPQPLPSNWTPTWPLPESADLKYSNSALITGGTDGKPVGDPGWFTDGYTTGIAQTLAQIPGKFTLYDAYPNPFNPSTNIKFSISQAGLVSLKVYNTLGQLVKTIVDNVYKAKGDYQVNISMDNLSSGVYFYRLEEGNNAITKKMVLLK
jgi:Secretion system C-terminal sorting domain